MIFVPLTTVTLSTISKEEMGNATGVFNLLRNIGGGVGIAISATMLSRSSQFYQNNLAARVNEFDPVTRSRIEELTAAAISRGVDAVSAKKMALAVLYREVGRQSAMLSYDYIFWTIGVAFLLIIPFLILLKKPHRGGKAAASH
jgi:DHA2 family multidrug resistance protein